MISYCVAATDSRICFYDTSHGNVLNRLHLQKRIMQLLRKIEHCTHGVQPAWEETFRLVFISLMQIACSNIVFFRRFAEIGK